MIVKVIIDIEAAYKNEYANIFKYYVVKIC